MKFFVLKFDTADEAIDFFKTHKGTPETPSVNLRYNDHQMYISLNKFGRERVLEIFAKKAATLIRDHKDLLGVHTDTKVNCSPVSGGILIGKALLGHVVVDKTRTEAGHYPVTFSFYRNRTSEGLSADFKEDIFVTKFKELARF